mmetsp:Transcript_22826/g.65618  ORF Transcript_22826/g.65618 Transcript_22826/m.65618 type:complete len:480 (-) Transcript_22826:82-1521(-)
MAPHLSQGFGTCAMAVAVWMAQSASAMKFEFDSAEPIAPYTLTTQYMFYVETESGASGQTHADALVSIDAMIIPDAQAKNPTSASEVARYAKVQASILLNEDLGNTINTKRFCGHDGVVFEESSAILAGQTAGPFKLSDQKSKQQANLTRSGVYVLVVTNCGNLTGVKVSGAVSVKNPHGFSSALDQHTANMYWGFLALYVVVLLVWLLATIRSWKQLYEVQKGIVPISVLAAIECCLMGVVYYTDNQTDVFNVDLFLAASLTSAWKVCELFRMAVQSAELLCGTEENAPGLMSRATLILALSSYMVADFNFRDVLRLRFAYAMPLDHVLRNSFPCFLVGLAIFCWCHVTMFRQREVFKLNGQEVEASLIAKSHMILWLGTVGALLVSYAQLADPTHTESVNSWKLHGLISVGLPQLVFAIVLSSCMCVWWPSEATLMHERGQAGPDEECQPIGATWNDDAVDEIEPADGVDKGSSPAE